MKGNGSKPLRQDMTKQARQEFWKNQICCTCTLFCSCFFVYFLSSAVFLRRHLHWFKSQWIVLLPSISLQVLCPVRWSKSYFRVYSSILSFVPNLHPLLQCRFHGCKMSPSWRHFSLAAYPETGASRSVFSFPFAGVWVFKAGSSGLQMNGFNLASTCERMGAFVWSRSATASVSECGVSSCGSRFGACSSCCSW